MDQQSLHTDKSLERLLEDEKNAMLYDYLRCEMHPTDPQIARMLNLIEKIEYLKREKNAVIVGHFYMTPDIKEGISDSVGDSLEMNKAVISLQNDAARIHVAGVKFMAQTIAAYNPGKEVYIPSLEAGCSLADGITANDVLELKAQHPNARVVTYINTGAEIKALSDCIVTSRNYKQILNHFFFEEGADKIIFIPDAYLAANAISELSTDPRAQGKKIIPWSAKCIVHEQFTPGEIAKLKRQYGQSETTPVHVITHPECSPQVALVSDYVGGTQGMINYVRQNKDKVKNFIMITECDMASTIRKQVTDVNVVGPCQICPYMKKITLENMFESLLYDRHRIIVDPQTAASARRATERMFEIAP